MKKISFFLLIALFIGLSGSAFSQEGRALKNGFGLQFQLGFPSDQYGLDKDYDLSGSTLEKPGMLLGLQIGNRWYVNRGEKTGIAIMANWFDISWSQKKDADDNARGVLDVALLEVGPAFTYALNSDMAIDAYYNLRPTVLSSVVIDSNKNGIGSVGFGVTHALGAAFRYKVLYIGAEYVLGNVNGTYADLGDFTGADALGDSKMVINNFRILLGFKF